MQKLVLKKSKKFNKFLIVEYSGDTIFYLGDTVTDFYLGDMNEYIEWALNPDEVYMGFNVAELEKENDYILIGSELSEQDDGGPFYKISIPEFIKLLLKWKELVEANVDTITITDNDGILDIVGSYAKINI